jgi:hypothetical protein
MAELEEQRVAAVVEQLGDELIVGARRRERRGREAARVYANEVDVVDRALLRTREPPCLGPNENQLLVPDDGERCGVRWDRVYSAGSSSRPVERGVVVDTAAFADARRSGELSARRWASFRNDGTTTIARGVGSN